MKEAVFSKRSQNALKKTVNINTTYYFPAQYMLSNIYNIKMPGYLFVLFCRSNLTNQDFISRS